MRRVVALLICALVMATGCTGAFAQIADLNSAINKAGRQRMLSQRIAKLYLQIGQGIDAERSRRNLDSSLSLFDRQLVELKNYSAVPAIKETYQKLERSWLAYKDLLIGTPPTPENARKVIALSEEVLSLAQQGTALLEKQSGTTTARLVNVAGRERMLSQRMAKFYQALAWGVAPGNGGSELDLARKEFVAGLAELEGAKANTQSITDELALARQQFLFFDAALKGASADRRTSSTNVATTSERILEVMDDVTGMYEKTTK